MPSPPTGSRPSAGSERPQLTVNGVPPEVSRQSTDANWAGSMVPFEVTQSMRSWRI